MNSNATNGNQLGAVPQEDLKIYRCLMKESQIAIDDEVLIVIANLLKLNISPDEIYSVLTQIAPVCGLLRKYRLKPRNPPQPEQPDGGTANNNS